MRGAYKTFLLQDDNAPEDGVTEIVATNDNEVNTVIYEEQVTPTTGPISKSVTPHVQKRKRVHEIKNIMTELKGLNKSLNKPIEEN